MKSSQTILLLIGVFLWYFSSIMVNVHWKSTFKNYGLTQSSTNQHYHYAMFFTTVQFAVGAVTSFILIFCLGKLGNLYSILLWWKKGLIIGSFFYLGQLSTNMSLTMNSVTLTHMVKTLEPLLALLWALTILKNKISGLSIMYMFIMLIGVFLTSYNEVTFNLTGVIFAIVSNVSLSLRNLFIKLSNKNEMFNGLQLFFVSCLVGFLYSYCLYFFYAQSSANAEYDFFNSDSIKMGLYFSGQHIMSYVLLFGITITTHALLNCLKRALIIFISAVLLGVNLPAIQVLGIIVTIFGTILYVIEIKKPLNTKPEDIGGSNLSSFINKLNFGRALIKHYKIILCIPVILLLFLTATGSNHDVQKMLQNHKSKTISLTAVWAFDAPLNKKALDLINMNSDASINKLNIFCSNVEKCKKSAIELNSTTLQIQILQLKAFELTKDTPVAAWMASHPINKLKSVLCFPVYFHKMLYVSTLWKYGGPVADMALHLKENTDVKDFMISSSFEGCILDENQSSALICNLSPQHKYTEVLIGEISKLFIKDPKSCIFDCSLQAPTDITKTISSNLEYNVPSLVRKFGLLSYGRTHNLGDEMQSIGAANILPNIYTFIERSSFKNPDRINLTYIGNAYWMDGILFKKVPNLTTVPVSIHISPFRYKKIPALKDHFSSMAPIGARDFKTYEKFMENGIESIFTGCITLWLTNPNVLTNIKRNNDIIVVDPRWTGDSLLPDSLTNVKYRSHYWDQKGQNLQMKHYSDEERYISAYELLMEYAQAKVVVTSRIHVALPCVAIGTPVIYYNIKGYYWDSSDVEPTPRVSGLLDLFHTADMYKLNETGMVEYFKNFNWNDPPPNPNPDKVKLLKSKAKVILERIPELDVAMKVFELI